MTSKISTVTPFEFEGYLLFGVRIGLQSKLEMLLFDVSISNERLHIVSRNTIQ